jgi:hypothetical protein
MIKYACLLCGECELAKYQLFAALLTSVTKFQSIGSTPHGDFLNLKKMCVCFIGESTYLFDNCEAHTCFDQI